MRNIIAIATLVLSPCLFAQQSAPVTPSEIYKRAAPAVVSIELLDNKGEVAKTGSGFLVSSDGKILTNFHVISHSKRATVRLANKDAYDEVEVLDIDKRKDIALIKIKAVDLPFLTLGRSAGVEVGETIYSLGNPLGILENTLSQGIISGIRLGDGYRYFQMSAPISHGSSGGPVFNSQGEVVAITAATLEEGQNLNFAVPIDYARGMLSATQARPLAAIYEPAPENEMPASTAGKSTADEMQSGSLVYLEGKLGKWKEPDARKVLGEPFTHRSGPPALSAEVYGYNDPKKSFREIDLVFDKETGYLNSVVAFPWRMTWNECKQLWGDNARIIKYQNGTREHSYKDRHLNVLVDSRGQVVNIGVY